MADDDRVGKALATVRNSIRKAQEDLVVLEALLVGELTPGQQANRLLKRHCELWSEIHKGKTYPVAGAKDTEAFKRLLRSMPFKEISALQPQFFSSRDEFIQNSGYTVGVFASQLAKFISKRTRLTPAARRVNDWRDECRDVHGGRCTNAHFHQALMDDLAEGSGLTNVPKGRE